MSDVCGLIWHAVAGLFRSRAALQAEILVLRHQLNVLHRRSPRRVALSNVDRLVFVGFYRVAATVLDALKIVQPGTVIRWHHAGFRAYWRWTSRPGGGRPQISADIRRLILEMSIANPLWGAPPWRTAQTRDQCRPDHSRKIHGREKAATVARLEDLSSQSCRWYRVDRYVCRSYDFVSTALRIIGRTAFTARAAMAGCDRTSDSGLPIN